MSECYPSDEDTADGSSLCTETTTSTMESFSEIQGQLSALTGLMEVLMTQTNEMESQMKTMQRPLEGLALDQLGDIPHLAASPFRKQMFAYKRALPGIDVSQRYSFETICAHFRAYMFGQNLVDADGQITADAHLANVFEIQVGTKLNFMEMLGRLRRCVQ
jgi:hypothetical protein